MDKLLYSSPDIVGSSPTPLTMTRRTKPVGAHTGPESAFQKSAVQLIEMIAGSAGVPKEAIMHIPSGAMLAGNERQRAAQVARLKSQGWRPGYPDIMVFAPKWGECRWLGDEVEGECGFCIEAKIWPGKPSPEQLKIHSILRNAGWLVSVCYGLGEVEAIAKAYFGK